MQLQYFCLLVCWVSLAPAEALSLEWVCHNSSASFCGVRLELLKLPGGFQQCDINVDPLQAMPMAPLHPAPPIFFIGWRGEVAPVEWSFGTLTGQV